MRRLKFLLSLVAEGDWIGELIGVLGGNPIIIMAFILVRVLARGVRCILDRESVRNTRYAYQRRLPISARGQILLAERRPAGRAQGTHRRWQNPRRARAVHRKLLRSKPSR